MKLDIAYPTRREDIVFRDLVEKYAKTQPDRIFAQFEDGSIWTWGELREKAVHIARGLRALGVSQGDHVISWQPTSADAIRTWFGINYLGAVYVPFNTAYRGGVLEHVVWLSDAKLAVVHADLLGRMGEVNPHDVKTIVAVGGEARPVEGYEVLDQAALSPGPPPGADEAPPELERPIEPWDNQSMIFTSGTTGPSKGVLSSYKQLGMSGNILYYWLTADDRALVNLPLFHISGTTLLTRMLAIGGSIAVVESFRTEEFWSVIRRLGVTCTLMMGSISTFLMKLPEDDDQRNSPLKSVLIPPLTSEVIAYAKRIGVDWYTTFSMTEANVPLISRPNPEKPGTCGRIRRGAEVRIVDEHDNEVPVGAVGELIIRDDEPWALCSGYHKNPEATAKAWRNGWFHTGDAVRRDDDGDFYFVDRLKDAIRRRGENISSYEVEVEVNAHPDVREAAAIAVASEHGEDEVMVVVMPVEGRTIDPKALVEFLIPRMPHFMVPRYVRVMKELPRTPTTKVQKVRLREAGVTDDTFDREAAGIRVRRHSFRKSA
ncbi:AMP-binding protein [Minwuia thermotolerans]|uniref:ATP-dependent acyl-CoA ligase n=1 Tax=Minwuia thermotolerans TaxID=2056226 RepID=A0A2M9G7P6_9PROT|nr:AMP-binding protein [Minwuia thermotolerans]PJK31723.1 ATP-dependent acyl-CoA ligase [Minwuia thermotolerans]